MTRRLYIDWLRGVAVLLMMLWHVIDAWTVQVGRDTMGFFAVAFAGGWAAPLFLFLAGVSMPLAAVKISQGQNRNVAARALQRRGWQVFGLAHVFRFQSFLLNPNGSWHSILKPDILNILGLGLVLIAEGWRHATTRRAVVLWLVVPAVVIVAVMTPWARLWWWPTLLHPRLEAYIRPVGNFGVFSLFPALGFMFAGAAVGQRLATDGDGVLRRLGVAGVAMIALGTMASLGLGPATGRWYDAALVFTWRTGAMVLMLALAREFFERRPLQPSARLVLFGRTSLFVYWVHVELVYGIFSYPLHHLLTLPWSLGCYVGVVWLMGELSAVWARRSARTPWIPAHMTAPA